jgi:uncharacterized membrane protein
MKPLIRYTILAVLILAGTSASFANDYAIPTIEVDVTVRDDGSIKIVEHRTYVFNGEFSWADYRLPKSGYSAIDSIRVSENGTAYINANNEETGTFSVSESDNAFTIKWHYSAENTSRTFTISYVLDGAMSIGPKFTEFFWNYLASGREKSTNMFDLTFRLPGDVSQDSLYTFTRSKADDFSFNYLTNGYDASGMAISRRQSARIRTLFPTSLFDAGSISITAPDLTLESVLDSEEEYREELQAAAEWEEFMNSITLEATIILCLLSIVIFVLLYRKYGSRHSTSSLSTRETLVIPGQEAPAIIGKLMTSQQTSSNHLVATLFNLARQGWFTITEEENEDTGWLSSKESKFRVAMADNSMESDDSLLRHEQMVLDFAKERIAGGDDTFDELFKGTESEVSKWYRKWQKQVKQEFEKKEWIDKKSYVGVTINFLLQAVLLIASVVLLVNGGPTALAALVCSLLFTIASFFIIRRTPDGQETHHRWKAYADGLKNADERTIRMEMLDRHFIYAVAFHLGKKQLTTLLDSTNEPANSVIPWIILTHGSTANAASVASSISTLAATGSTSFTGATAAGTGASVGAAGGGASGGAG